MLINYDSGVVLTRKLHIVWLFRVVIYGRREFIGLTLELVVSLNSTLLHIFSHRLLTPARDIKYESSVTRLDKL